MNDWRTCPACAKLYALKFSTDELTKARIEACKFCPHRVVTPAPQPKVKVTA